MRIRPRIPKIDVSAAELHWVANDPQLTHTVNVLSLLLPAGERYFVKLFKSALPLVKEKALRDDVRGFIGQEAQHAEAHQRVIEHLQSQGFDVTPFTGEVEWLFDVLVADEPFGKKLPAALVPWWLRERVGIVAAIEHFTTLLGAWMLEADELKNASTNDEMIRLLMWHAAEEVEHRAVAYDLYYALGGTYAGRVRGMVIVVPVLTALWVDGVRFMMKNDPSRPGPSTLRRFVAAGEAGLLPTFGSIGRAIGRYLRPRHHPSEEHAPPIGARILAAISPFATATAQSPQSA